MFVRIEAFSREKSEHVKIEIIHERNSDVNTLLTISAKCRAHIVEYFLFVHCCLVAVKVSEVAEKGGFFKSGSSSRVETKILPPNPSTELLRKTTKGNERADFCKTFRFLLRSQVKACHNSRDRTDDGSKYDRTRKLQEYYKEAGLKYRWVVR